MSIDGKQFKSRWRSGDESICEWMAQFRHGQQADVIRLALYLLAGARHENLPRDLQLLTESENLPDSIRVESSGNASVTVVNDMTPIADALRELKAVLVANPTPARAVSSPPGLPLPQRSETISGGIDMSGPRPQRAPRVSAVAPEQVAPFDAEACRRQLVNSINAFGKGER